FECLKSISNNILDSVQVIIVNDGSKDDSDKIITSEFTDFINKENVEYLIQPNKGLSEARNSGIKLSSGEYIGFLDADDMLDDDYFRCIIDNILRSECDMYCFGYTEISEQGDILSEPKTVFSGIITSDVKIDLFCKNEWYAQMRVYKRHLFDFDYFKPNACYEDIELIPRLTEKALSIKLINSSLYFYRVNSLGISRNIDERKINDLKFSMNQACRIEDSLLRSIFESNLIVLINSFENILKVDLTKFRRPKFTLRLLPCFKLMSKLSMVVLFSPKWARFYINRIKR
ncbi:glycosyltransferase family 2 protein, partial [Vibrio jasicida]|uniref:glycosyltransferase family 2 protein n=1 Tax=Vibrio jasicida TaxID=766224 RepID=UPI0011B0A334